MAKKKSRPQHRPQHAPLPPALPLLEDDVDALDDPGAFSSFPPPELLSMMTEQVIREMTGRPLSAAAAQAQELYIQALQARTPAKQQALARQALDIDPDFTDAYLFLSDLAANRKERLHLLEQAVAAGERGFDRTALTDPARTGRFWSIVETHPYLRARLALASFLWRIGRHEEALAHYQELLRLDAEDYQGVRYVLATSLLELDRRVELAALLQRFPRERAPGWKFMRALLAFREEGDTPHSRKLLKAADKADPAILDFLFNPALLFASPEDGGPATAEDEDAASYVQANQGAWRNTPGALDWASRVSSGTAKRKPKEPAAKGPTAKSKEQLAALRPVAEDWEVDFRRLPLWIDSGSGMTRPWMVLMVNRTKGIPVGQQLLTVPPTQDMLWDLFAQAMLHPSAGKASRPAVIHVPHQELLAGLQPHLAEAGVPLRQEETLPFWNRLFADMLRSLDDVDDRPGLLSIPGIKPEHLERFYTAAAEFYRRAPWSLLDADYAIRLATDHFSGGPWFGMLMGQMGMASGLALYSDLKMLRASTKPGHSPEEHARKTKALSLLYGEQMHTPCPDLDALETHPWPIAGPAAYPWLFRKEKGLKMVLPSRNDVELMTAALTAIPDFVAAHNLDDEAQETVEVPLAEGSVRLTLSWERLV
jgi:tetratricopeptide (TPR) repeat protein